MKKIYIGFSTPKKFNVLSWLIKKTQGTEFSHVYLRFHSDSLDRDLVYQASGLQVNFVGTGHFYSHHVVVEEFAIPVSEEIYKKTLQFAVDKAGYPYSLLQLISIASYMMLKKELMKDGRASYVCSELVGQILEQELDIKVNKDLDVITPKDVYDILQGLIWPD